MDFQWKLKRDKVCQNPVRYAKITFGMLKQIMVKLQNNATVLV